MRQSFILIISVSVLFIGCASTSMQSQNKVKITGGELEQWLSSYHSYAGTNEENGCVFIVVSHSADRRIQYYDCPFGAGIGKGTARVDGDKMCTKWDYGAMLERCSEVYRLGEDRYEQNDGAIKYYKLK